jgi:hypothetical protein
MPVIGDAFFLRSPDGRRFVNWSYSEA